MRNAKRLLSSAVTGISLVLLAVLAVPTLLLLGIMGAVWSGSDKLTEKLR